MRWFRLILFSAICGLASAEDAVVMKPVRVTPNDYDVEIEYTKATKEIVQMRVCSVKSGSAVEKLGVRVGDSLIAIDGASVVGMKLSEFFEAEKVRGRREIRFAGYHGLFRKKWSALFEFESKKKEPNQPPEPAPTSRGGSS